MPEFALGLRWRIVVFVLAALTTIHFVFVDDTLRSAYKTHLAHLDDVHAPDVKPVVAAGEEKQKEKQT